MSLNVSIHDESHRGGESLKAEAQLVRGGELGDFCSVTIADGNPKDMSKDHIKVFSSSPENLRAIAEAFLDAAVLLESAKPKPEVPPALQQDPFKTITHADGVKAEEIPL